MLHLLLLKGLGRPSVPLAAICKQSRSSRSCSQSVPGALHHPLTKFHRHCWPALFLPALPCHFTVLCKVCARPSTESQPCAPSEPHQKAAPVLMTNAGLLMNRRSLPLSDTSPEQPCYSTSVTLSPSSKSLALGMSNRICNITVYTNALRYKT